MVKLKKANPVMAILVVTNGALLIRNGADWLTVTAFVFAVVALLWGVFK